jgi:hypothetical protein
VGGRLAARCGEPAPRPEARRLTARSGGLEPSARKKTPEGAPRGGGINRGQGGVLQWLLVDFPKKSEIPILRTKQLAVRMRLCTFNQSDFLIGKAIECVNQLVDLPVGRVDLALQQGGVLRGFCGSKLLMQG